MINRKLLRLSLFQFGLGFSVVIFSGTLNRVLINEEGIPATAVGWLFSLSLFVAPARAILGFRSDREKKTYGYRRLPYIWLGMMMIFGGLAVVPFTLWMLSKSSAVGQGVTPFWVALIVSTAFFLFYALGVHIAQTGYLALVTDLTPQKERGKAMAFVWTALILGQIVSSMVIGEWLRDYSTLKLIQVMQTASIIFLVLAITAIWKQDTVVEPKEDNDDLGTKVWTILVDNPQLRLFFLIVFVGTIGLTEQDVLLEPFGAQMLGMTVSETTRLTALWGAGMLAAMFISARTIPRLKIPLPVALVACAIGMGAFMIVVLSGSLKSVPLLALGAILIGVANGMFLMATLSLVVGLADVHTAGLYIGLWGLIQTTAIGISNILGAVIRDVSTQAMGDAGAGYGVVYMGEIFMLGLAFVLLLFMPRRYESLVPGQSAFAGLTDIPG